MITPGLFRRSLRRAFRWRLLLLFWASLAVPGAIAAGPVFAFLRAHLDFSPRAAASVASLEGSTAIELFRALHDGGTPRTLIAGFAAAVLALLVFAPFVAGAMVAAARSEEPLALRPLLAGGGELYGRMLRTSLAGLIPLGLAGAVVAGIAKLASDAIDRVRTGTAANRVVVAAAVAIAVLLFASHLIVDAARAQFAADPSRRSALAALWAAARISIKRPLRTLAIGAAGAAIALGLALAVMALRLRIEQSGVVGMALAWALAQAAQVAVGWGRAFRIEGLAELCRADSAVPAERPPAPPATVSALEPPPSGAAR